MSDKIKAAISLTPAMIAAIYIFGIHYIIKNGITVLPVSIFFILAWALVFFGAWCALTNAEGKSK